jgi:hypothetical protein
MTRWHAWLFHLTATVVTATGVLYWMLATFAANDDPFSIVNPPLQPFILKAHIVSAPLLIFALGIILDAHVVKNLRRGGRSNRRSGLASLVTFAAMALSGYGLQISSGSFVSQAALWVHVSSGFAFALTYSAHQIISFRLLRPSFHLRKSVQSV